MNIYAAPYVSFWAPCTGLPGTEAFNYTIIYVPFLSTTTPANFFI